MTDGLKNEFRNDVKKEGKSPVELEAEQVGDAEMLCRDQFATMRQLQVEKQMRMADAAHTQLAIDEYARFLNELKDLPLSAAREGVAAVVIKQLESLGKQLAASKFPRITEVTLAALEAVFASTEIEVGAKPEEAGPDDEGLNSPALGIDETEPEELKDD